MPKTPPHWDLSNVYPSLDSAELAADIAWTKDAGVELKRIYDEELKKVTPESPDEEINLAISTVVDQLNAIMLKAVTIRAYIQSFLTTDSYNKELCRSVPSLIR